MHHTSVFWVFWGMNELHSKISTVLREKHKQMTELKSSLLIVRKNVLNSGGIYTASKIFTLPPAVTAGTNTTSEMNKISSLAGYNLKNISSSQKEPWIVLRRTFAKMTNAHSCKKSQNVSNFTSSANKKNVYGCKNKSQNVPNCRTFANLRYIDSKASRCRIINFYRKKDRCFKLRATLTYVFCQKNYCVAKKYKCVSNFRTFANPKNVLCCKKIRECDQF